MKILVTGGCGFVGANICIKLREKKYKIFSLDNLSRKGSKFNLNILKNLSIKNFKVDISDYKKILKLPKFDLIIDCCAEASVEVSRNDLDRVINTNFIGTFNILKKAKKDNSKIIFISSSRVNSINTIFKILNKKKLNKVVNINKKINENFETSKPKSIYGLTKLASEMLIEEFSYAFNLKYIINRCGVISGPLQFGKQDQGFVSLWIWSHIIKKNLKYIGYGGNGHQIRDVLHIADLTDLIEMQIKKLDKINNKLFCVGGSDHSYTSLKKLTKICENITRNKIKFTKNSKTSIYDIPYFITNNSKVSKVYKWKPKRNILDVVRDTYKWLIFNQKQLKKYL
jgi:CDP-paratose 2-epimerase|tara:strand:+ start:1170 stop:2192 length:1023 start_codon:yes stop_codon:yes gene_type:complete